MYRDLAENSPADLVCDNACGESAQSSGHNEGSVCHAVEKVVVDGCVFLLFVWLFGIARFVRRFAASLAVLIEFQNCLS